MENKLNSITAQRKNIEEKISQYLSHKEKYMQNALQERDVETLQREIEMAEEIIRLLLKFEADAGEYTQFLMKVREDIGKEKYHI